MDQLRVRTGETSISLAEFAEHIINDPDADPELRRQAQELRASSTYDLKSLPAELQARAAAMQERAVSRMSTISPEVKKRTHALLNMAVSAKTSGKRIQWLHRAASTLGDGYASAAACKSGCSYCCNIPVVISAAEARAIGAAIRVIPVEPEQHVSASAVGVRNACTFLANGLCAIYEHRPSTCRTHLNLDDDDLMCRPYAHGNVPVANLDATPVVIAAMRIAGAGPWADLRQWFPFGLTPTAEFPTEPTHSP